jgi:hypothetical protein
MSNVNMWLVLVLLGSLAINFGFAAREWTRWRITWRRSGRW